MGTTVCDLHSGLERNTVHRRRYLADTAARLLNDLTAAVCSCFLVSFFRCTRTNNLVKGEFLSRLYDRSVDRLRRQLDIRISLLVRGRLCRKCRKSLILLSRISLGKFRCRLIDLRLDHRIIISTRHRLNKIRRKFFLIHGLTRRSVCEQELITRCVILRDRAILRLHIPFCRCVCRCLCRCGLQILGIFHRECIFSAILVSRNPVQKGIQLRVDHVVRVHALPVVRDLHIPRKLRLDGSFRLALCHSL